jgi:adenylate cyclase class 2
MATEIEIKMKVADLDAVRARLSGVGAVRRGSRFELNAFFDTAERSLKANGSGLRLRTMTDEAGQSKSVITLKGKATGEGIKSREEIEFSIGDADGAAALLDRLGYRATLGFEKRRETWELGGCLVELDELPHLGTFVEIEGADEAAIVAVRRQLALNDEPTIQNGYISMIDRLVREQRTLGPTVRFT